MQKIAINAQAGFSPDAPESVEARIQIPAPLKTFSDKEVMSAFIQTMQGVADYGQNHSLSHLYKPFTVIMKLLPQAITITTGLRVMPVSLNIFKDAVYFKKPVRQIGANTIGYMTASTKAGDLVKEITRFMSQEKSGSVFCLDRVDGESGMLFSEFILFVSKNLDMLKAAAAKAGLEDKFEAASKRLESTNIKPNEGFYITTKSTPVYLKDLNKALAAIDFNGNKQGDLYNITQLPKLLEKMEAGYGEATGEDVHVSDGADLASFRNQRIVMIGTPPPGWSTSKFQQALEEVDAQVDSKFQFGTKVAFYNPTQVSGEKIEKAQRMGLRMVPYADAVKAILRG